MGSIYQMSSGSGSGSGSDSAPTEYKPDVTTEYTSQFLLTDEEMAAKGIKDHEYAAFRRVHYQFAFAVDKWVDGLEDVTFRTEMVAISFAEATALRNEYRRSRVAADCAAA